MQSIAQLLVAFVVLLCSGCSLLKEQTGEFVTEATIDAIVRRVDDKLEERGLSRDEIKGVLDLDRNGTISTDEIKESAKGAVSDLLTARLETERVRREAELENLKHNTDGSMQDTWLYIKGQFALLILAVFSYLVKQIFSAKKYGKKDADTHARLSVLERGMQIDLDGDGIIGDAPLPPQVEVE